MANAATGATDNSSLSGVKSFRCMYFAYAYEQIAVKQFDCSMVRHAICRVSDETLTGQTSACGVLKVLAGMLKHGRRDDLIEFGKLFISCTSVIINKMLINNVN